MNLLVGYKVGRTTLRPVKIGELANRTGVSTRTIRYYERIGLIPSPERASNGYRRYGPSSLDRLGFIKDAQAAGLSLAEIGMILDMKDEGESTCDHVVWLLEEHVQAVDRQMEELRRTRVRLRGMVDRARSLDPADCQDPNRCQTIGPVASDQAIERKEVIMTTKTTLNVPEIHCGHCKSSIEGAVGTLEGVEEVSVSVENATVDVAFDDEVIALDAIKDTIEEQGYAVAG
jgi:MerR family transcriptional regulator, copper efflux regulator